MHFIYCEKCGKVIGFAEFAEGAEPEQEYYLCPECAKRILHAAAPNARKEE